MRVLQNEEVVSTIRATLQYFHIFKHPLYLEEIHRFSPMDIPVNELYHALREMVITGAIYEYDNFYMLEDNKELVNRRLEGKQRADALMDEAYRSASRIARFPFVESVCISGSLSKGYANEKSDIDLFIITKKNRLWICRTILHLFKKMTFLWNAQHSFCMNYFIDESKLCIEEQNRFTATELATLIPAYNSFVYRRLIDENRAWLVNMFPNINWNSGTLITKKEPKTFRRIWEQGINLIFPKQINLLLMNVTNKWWRFKWQRKGYPMQDYDLAMKTKWYVSKNHPLNYQKKVLKQLKEQNHPHLATALG